MLNEIDVHVGHRLRRRRKSLSMNQCELGERIGVKFQQIHKYETGKSRISASRLWKAADALSVDVGYFFEGLDFGRSAEESSCIKTETLLMRDTNELCKVISLMDAHQRSKLQHLFESMKR